MEAAADDFELDWSNSIGPAKGVYRGKEQVREVWTSFLEAFGALRWDPEEIVEVDERQGAKHQALPVEGRGPRSRRGAGVGDVGGECRARLPVLAAPISLVGWFIVDRAQAWLCAVSTRRLIVAAERRLLLDTARVQA